MSLPAREVRFTRPVDLSLEIGPDTQMFPTYPQPAFTQWTTREAQGFLAESLFFVSHTGTHVDAPWHFEPEGKKLDEVPLDRFVVPGHVLDLPGLREAEGISREALRRAREALGRSFVRGDAVLLRTGWEERRGRPDYLFRNPGLTEAAAREIVAWGAGLVGIDAANVDRAGDLAYPAHHALLRADVLILENVANLGAVGNEPFLLLALPLRLRGATGSPVRLVALVDERDPRKP